MYTYDFLNVKYFYLELNFTYIILHLFNRKTNKYFQNKIYVLRIIIGRTILHALNFEFWMTYLSVRFWSSSHSDKGKYCHIFLWYNFTSFSRNKQNIIRSNFEMKNFKLNCFLEKYEKIKVKILPDFRFPPNTTLRN
jgi:hypothetical protein